MESSNADGKRKRAQKACQFCHQRKMKCNNELPTCSNCVTHGQTCTYTQGSKRPRPSNERISRLEEENRQLHASLATGTTSRGQEAHESAQTRRSSIPEGPREDSAGALPYSSRKDGKSTVMDGSSLSPAKADALASAEFHGPSSVLFDENGPNAGQITDANFREHVLQPPSSKLMGNAATQRQLESIHFSTKQLDTDGVDQSFAEELLSLFWKTANSAFLVVYRPAFMRDWACGGPYYSKLLLNAIYHNASRHASEESIHRYSSNVANLRSSFVQRFKMLLREEFEHSKTTTIQALLVMSASISALNHGRSFAWLYSGMAYRMIIDLGLHTTKTCSSLSKQGSEEDIEIQRRVFWSAFVIDKLQSFYYGRPASIQQADISTLLTFRDHYDELEQWAPMESSSLVPGSYSPTYNVSNFSRLCKLSLVMNNILNDIYGEKKRVEDPDLLHRSLTRLNHDLDEWHDSMPPHLKFSPCSIGLDTAPVPAPHTYAVTIMYYVLQILLHRPFVSEGHLQSALPTVALECFSSCVAAADSIAQYLDSFNRAHTFKKLPYFLFYASYVSATIHVRIAAQKQLETNAYAYLRTCFLVFDLNSEGNTAAAKAKAVIQQLMVRMGVSLPTDTSPQSVSTNVHGDSAIRPENTPQDSYRDTGLQTDPDIDVGLGTSQPPDWDLGDLDFDAVLQSFDPSSQADGSSSKFQTTTDAGPQQSSDAVKDSSEMSHEINTSDTIGNDIIQGLDNDVLFGFDNTDSRYLY